MPRMSSSSSDIEEETVEDMKELSESEEGSDESQPEEVYVQDTTPRKSGNKKKKKKRLELGESKYKNVILMNDHNGKLFYAYKDPDMIRWLGATTFMNILRFSPPGLVKDKKVGDDGNLRLYKMTMQHSRRKAACLYTEQEYEALAVEAHVHSKNPEAKLLHGGRKPFFGIHCKQQCHDKNRLSWHCLAGECEKYKGEAFLKMYPTWSQTNSEELRRILRNQGQDVQDEDAPVKRRRKAATMSAPKKKAKLDVRKPAAIEHSAKDIPKPKAGVSGVPSQPARPRQEVDLRQLGNKTKGSPGSASTHSARETRSKSHARLAQETMQDNDGDPSWAEHIHPVVDDSRTSRRRVLTLAQLQATSMQDKGSNDVEKDIPDTNTATPPVRTREDVEAEAKAVAAKFTLEDEGGLRAMPKEVSWSGVALLVYDSGLVVDPELLKDPEAATKELRKMHEHGILSKKLYEVLGMWLYEDEDDEQEKVRTVELTQQVRKEVQKSVKAFDPKSFKTGGLEEAITDGLQQVQRYLAYHNDLDRYGFERLEAERVLQDLQKKHVHERLELFDNAQSLADEQKRWQWSPLYCMWTTMPIGRTRRAPWKHTPQELDSFLEEWSSDQADFSLDRDCPQILRALKMMVRRVSAKVEPLAHPMLGLTAEKVLSIARDDPTSKRLVAAMQDFIEHGWIFFPSMYYSLEPVHQCRSDLVALLGYGGPQQEVVAKVLAFLQRMVRRALLDMQHTGQRQQLDTLWIRQDTTDAEKEECQKAFRKTLALREDIDMGWVFVGETTNAHGVLRTPEILQKTVQAMQDLRISGILAVNRLAFLGSGRDTRKSTDQSDANIAQPDLDIPANQSEDRSVVDVQSLTTPRFLRGLEEYCAQNFVPNSVGDPLPAELAFEDDVVQFHINTLPKARSIGDGPAFGREFVPKVTQEKAPATSPCNTVTVAPYLPVPKTSGSSGSRPAQLQTIEKGRDVPHNGTTAMQEHSGDSAITPVNEADSMAVEVAEEPLDRERLQEELDRIVDMAGGCKDFVLHFKNSGHVWSLAVPRDFASLFLPDGWISSALFDWFRQWCIKQYSSEKYLFCSPFLFSSLKDYVKGHKETYVLLEDFFTNKFPLDAGPKILLVPVVDADHWSLAIMSNDRLLYHFDSLHSKTMHGTTTFYRLLGKVWAHRQKIIPEKGPYGYAVDRRSWKRPEVPEQCGAWECGFWTMQYALTYIQRLSIGKDSLSEVAHCIKNDDGITMRDWFKKTLHQVLRSVHGPSPEWQVTLSPAKRRCTTIEQEDEDSDCVILMQTPPPGGDKRKEPVNGLDGSGSVNTAEPGSEMQDMLSPREIEYPS